MSERLAMSLDQIMEGNQTKAGNNRRTGSGRVGAVRSSANNRDARRSVPYTNKRISNRVEGMVIERPQSKHECAIKFLLSNPMMGAAIGSGGNSIKELIDITGASVHAAAMENKFPNSNKRVLYITGSHECVSLALSLIWEMIGHVTSENEGAWNPSVSKASPGDYDDVQVSNQLAIPAASAGILLGKGGATFRSISEESGAELTINDKSESGLIEERVLTISGTVAQCMNCAAIVLGKMSEQEDGFAYLINGSGYPTRLTGQVQGQVQGQGGRGGGSKGVDHRDYSVQQPRLVSMFRDPRETAQNSRFGGNARNVIPTKAKALVGSSSSTIELAVPDNLIGAILGLKGSTLDEIISVSGANVQVSSRGDFIGGTTNRRVTIVGPPACCSTAQMLINHKMHMEMQK